MYARADTDRRFRRGLGEILVLEILAVARGVGLLRRVDLVRDAGRLVRRQDLDGDLTARDLGIAELIPAKPQRPRAAVSIAA